MQIHQLSVTKKKACKRIGRGGKRGTTAGRGSNGQKSRTGASVDPLFEGGRSTFLERLKKVRGFKAVHAKKITVKLSDIERVYASGETVSIDTLIAKKLAPKNALSRGVKIVATGTLTKKLTLDKGIFASAKAKNAFGEIDK